MAIESSDSKQHWKANNAKHEANVYAALAEGRSVYTVKPNDTLSGIAAAANTNAQALWRANPQLLLNPNHVWPGMEIVLP